MQQDFESWRDVERAEILPSFGRKERRRFQLVTITRGAGTVAFILAIVTALINGWWMWAIFLSGCWVVYMREIE